MNRWERARLPLSVGPDIWLWCVAVVAYGVGDLTTTVVGLSTPNVSEINPLVASYVRQNGIFGIVLLKFGVFSLSYALWRITPRRFALIVPLVLSVFGIAATTWNLYVLLAANM
jgi:hypothetical protein